MKKKALITGISGQDGSYLAEFLIKKNYIVHGILRRSSLVKTDRIDHLYHNKKILNKKLFLHYGDLTDDNSVNRILADIKPDEIYNLAAQSHVMVSFEVPMYTANLDALGPLRILEAVKTLKLKTKIYQASTSEIFGDTKSRYMNEKTKFSPVSPYGIAKLYAFEIVRAYRKAYSLFASNGILFNHESPRRSETFVTRKITKGLKKFVETGKFFELGNLEAKRDWGHAKDYVEAMWKLLQLNKPVDMVFATGQTHSVEEFLIEGLKVLKIDYIKKTEKNITYFLEKKTKQIICKTNKRYIRPNEVPYLRGNSSYAKKVLNWKPKYNFKKLVHEMITAEFKNS
jgi:GDPmannose 4,6-dehydratase